MVIINELRVTPEGSCLIIEASVENLSYYKDINIAAVIIDTQDTFIPSGPSNRAIYHQSFDELQNFKHVRLVLDKKDLGVSLDNNIFFVYIVTNGTPTPDTPCGMDNLYTMGVTYNYRPIYNIGMNYIRELSNTCNVPRNFIDYILRYKAFDIAMRTGHYTVAFKYWKAFFEKKSLSISKPKRCGCYGDY